MYLNQSHSLFQPYHPMLDCVRLQPCKKVRLFLGKVTDACQRGRTEKITNVIIQWALHLRCMSCFRHQYDVHRSSFYILPKFVKQKFGHAVQSDLHPYLSIRPRVPMSSMNFAILHKQHKNKVVLL